jgi:tetratricopeptide (TPR) repeat protein
MKALIGLTLGCLLVLGSAQAEDDPTGLAALQARWAEINYQTPDKQKEDAFEALAEQAQALVEAYPNRAEPLIWQGIILSTYAGAKGGLGALSLVKQARRSLEAALEIDESALQGSAHTSLGSLYYQVPGWPIGFGSDRHAREHLQKALAINPAGIDSNYFFADFLLSEGEEDAAKQYFEKALAAPNRPDRPLADQGRREEIRAKLAELNS